MSRSAQISNLASKRPRSQSDRASTWCAWSTEPQISHNNIIYFVWWMSRLLIRAWSWMFGELMMIPKLGRTQMLISIQRPIFPVDGEGHIVGTWRHDFQNTVFPFILLAINKLYNGLQVVYIIDTCCLNRACQLHIFQPAQRSPTPGKLYQSVHVEVEGGVLNLPIWAEDFYEV